MFMPFEDELVMVGNEPPAELAHICAALAGTQQDMVMTPVCAKLCDDFGFKPTDPNLDMRDWEAGVGIAGLYHLVAPPGNQVSRAVDVARALRKTPKALEHMMYWAAYTPPMPKGPRPHYCHPSPKCKDRWCENKHHGRNPPRYAVAFPCTAWEARTPQMLKVLRYVCTVVGASVRADAQLARVAASSIYAGRFVECLVDASTWSCDSEATNTMVMAGAAAARALDALCAHDLRLSAHVARAHLNTLQHFSDDARAGAGGGEVRACLKDVVREVARRERAGEHAGAGDHPAGDNLPSEYLRLLDLRFDVQGYSFPNTNCNFIDYRSERNFCAALLDDQLRHEHALNRLNALLNPWHQELGFFSEVKLIDLKARAELNGKRARVVGKAGVDAQGRVRFPVEICDDAAKRGGKGGPADARQLRVRPVNITWPPLPTAWRTVHAGPGGEEDSEQSSDSSSDSGSDSGSDS